MNKEKKYELHVKLNNKIKIFFFFLSSVLYFLLPSPLVSTHQTYQKPLNFLTVLGLATDEKKNWENCKIADIALIQTFFHLSLTELCG